MAEAVDGNRVVLRILDELVQKLGSGDPGERCEDPPLEKLAKALEEVTILKVESSERTIGTLRLLGKALLSKIYLNLRECHLNLASSSESVGVKEKEGCLLVLESIASGSMPHLEVLSLKHLPVGLEGMQLIINAAEKGHISKLRLLESNGSHFGNAGFLALGTAAAEGHFQQLESLSSSGDHFPRDGYSLGVFTGMKTVARAMEEGCLRNLARLRLVGIMVGDDEAESLARAMRSSRLTSLKHFELYSPRIRAAGIIALGSAIESGYVPFLESLGIDKEKTPEKPWDRISEEGTQAIAKALASGHLRYLTTLELDGFKGGGLVTSALASHGIATLTTLSLANMELGAMEASNIARALAGLPSLRELYLHGNPLGENGWHALAAALESSTHGASQLVELDLGEPPGDDAVIRFAHLLAENRLPKLLTLGMAGNESPGLGESATMAVINAYQRNRLLTAHLHVSWPSGPSKENWMGFRRRNERGADDSSHGVQVDAVYGRVFLCGFPGVGKTTLRKSLSKTGSGLTPRLFGSSKQRCQSQTRGIEVLQLSRGNLKLAVWDLAGQQEYHVLHSAFFRDLGHSDQATIFVVVCRANAGNSHSEKDQKELHYWLRFIASSSTRGVDGFKRQVLIVFNRFHNHICEKSMAYWKVLLDMTKKEFEDRLDIEVDVERSTFDVRGKKHAKRFEKVLFRRAEALLKDKKIPALCLDLQKDLRVWSQENKEFPILTWTEVKKRLRIMGLENLSDGEITAALAYLSQVGTVINFPKGSLRDGDLADLNLTVASLEWFCQRVVGHLLLPEDLWVALRGKLDDSYSMKISELLNFYKGFTELQMTQTVAMLLRMGLCYKVGEDRIFIPALVHQNTSLPFWWVDPKPGQNQWTVGFSLVPEDRKTTLLPSSLFARLQVELGQDTLIRNSVGVCFCVGRSFVAFKAMGMFKVLVEYRAEETDYITDRVDIMVKPLFDETIDTTFEDRRKMRVSQVNFADVLLKKLDEIGSSCCPGLQVQRRVIQPWSTADIHPSMAKRDVTLLVETLKEELLEPNPDRIPHMNWDVAQERVDKVDLLSGDDLREISQKLSKAREETREKCELLETLGGALGVLPSVPTKAVSKFERVRSMPTWKGKSVEARLDVLEMEMEKMRIQLEGVKFDIKRNKYEIHKMKRTQKTLLDQIMFGEQTSTEEQINSVPRYAYFTHKSAGGAMRWLNLREAVIESCTLRLLCEARYDDQLLHEVDDQTGHDVTELKDWVLHSLPWLRRSVIALGIASSVGAAVLPGLGALAPAIVGASMRGAEAAIEEIRETSKTISDLRVSALSASGQSSTTGQYVKGASGGEPPPATGSAKKGLETLLGKLTSAKFSQIFRLRKVRFLQPNHSSAQAGRNYIVWICDDCLHKYLVEGKVEEIRD